MSTTPFTTVARVVRTTALGSEILAHRIDARAATWVMNADCDTRHDAKKGRAKEKSKILKLSRPVRSAMITLLPAVTLLLAFRPSALGSLLGCAGLYFVMIVIWGYSPTAALLAVYASIAIMWSPLMAVVALIWIPTAYHAVSRDPLASGGEETPTEEAGQPVEDSLVALVRNLIGDRYGAHLRDVVEALNQSSTGRQFTAPEVRAALEQRGVPTRAKVRAPQGGIQGAPETVTRGVHRDDLPTVPKLSETRTDDPSQDPSPDTPTDPVATSATSL